MRFASRVIIRVTVWLPPSPVVHFHGQAYRQHSSSNWALWHVPPLVVFCPSNPNSRLITTWCCCTFAIIPYTRFCSSWQRAKLSHQAVWHRTEGDGWLFCSVERGDCFVPTARLKVPTAVLLSSCLLACDVVSWYEWFPAFRRNVVPSYSPNHIASCPKRPKSSACSDFNTTLLNPQILHICGFTLCYRETRPVCNAL